MTDDSDGTRTLLTRRQIIAIFGTTLGAAIIAEGNTGLGGTDGGALYAGAAKLAELFQIGDGWWSGPLSVRSDVPEENGNNFIQTDAGENNDQYALWHYNNGWDVQGFDVASLTLEDTA